ncbi:hypothetical protein [Halobacterium sp. CBA1126]|uniref:hypothetical protein n=1 Tax=Halobacterium sp. CBA1126 TaxID=2668074 RepID=UPI0012FAB567|nr:hypothetical protein [Halobacterium sp. CBA1126]MUV61118.1 hypothetical protein [Halobacterium sp. CBA1126]
MSAVPAGLATDQQPPMTVPLRYFLAGFAFLLAGGAVGLAHVLGAAPGFARSRTSTCCSRAGSVSPSWAR